MGAGKREVQGAAGWGMQAWQGGGALGTPAILVDGLSKPYGPQRGLFGASFAVQAGEVFGFLGPNGAGKTTLIRILLAYLKPQSGGASILGLDCQREALAIRERIGYVPAEFRLDEHGSAASLLKHLASFRAPGTFRRAEALAERLELPLGGLIRTFSKGMKQKVALIQALMHEPEVLILDEPTEGLDPLMRRSFHEALREAASQGRTVFFSSHQLDEVDRLCDRAAVVGQGRILAVEGIAELRARQTRALRLRFSEALDASALALPQASFVAQSGPTQALFHLQGEAQGLAPALAALPLVDFVLEQAPLEEAFLSFYQSPPSSGSAP